MPIYEYECRDCGKVFEELLFGSEEGVACPHCLSRDVAKLMSAPGNRPSGKSGLAPISGGGCAPGKGFS